LESNYLEYTYREICENLDITESHLRLIFKHRGWRSGPKIIADVSLVLNYTITPRFVGTMSDLIDLTCDVASIDRNILVSKLRRREVVMLRQIIMHIGYYKMNFTLKTIGIHLGGRDHSTAVHGKDTISNLLDAKDPVVTKWYEEVRKRVVIDPDYNTEGRRKLLEERLEKVIQSYLEMDGTHEEKITHLAVQL